MAPELTIIAVVRVVAMCLGAYLVLVATAGVVARLLGARRAVGVLDRVTPLLVRQLIAALIGLTMTTNVAATAATQGGDPPVVLHRLPDDGATTTSTTTTTSVPSVPVPPAESPPATPEPAVATWTVQPRENFWVFAERMVARRLGRQPSPGEMLDYWRTLIEMNRDRLRHAENASLIYPGQTFVVPPS